MIKWIAPLCLLIVLLLSACSLPGSSSHATTAATLTPPQSSASTRVPMQTAPDFSMITTTKTTDTVPESDYTTQSAAVGSTGTAAASDYTAQTTAPPPVVVSLVIPEGYTLARIGMTLEDKNICTAQEFVDASQSGDFSGFSLIAAQPADVNRCFPLEGYLFPDTYEIYSNETPEQILRRLLLQTEAKLDSELRAKISASGYSLDQIITMASIIEKEALGQQHMANISSVLHNRLNQKMRLQCDVTIKYVEGAIKPFIKGDINRYNSYYNTYKCPALPAGPICNPGLAAIRAAVEPADTDYLFFVTDADNNYYYAATYEEHEQNVKKAGL